MIICKICIDLRHLLYDRAFEYIQKCQNFPCVRYDINIQRSGKTSEFTFYHGYFTFPLYVTTGRKDSVSLLAFTYICNGRKCSKLVLYVRYKTVHAPSTNNLKLLGYMTNLCPSV